MPCSAHILPSIQTIAVICTFLGTYVHFRWELLFPLTSCKKGLWRLYIACSPHVQTWDPCKHAADRCRSIANLRMCMQHNNVSYVTDKLLINDTVNAGCPVKLPFWLVIITLFGLPPRSHEMLIV